MKIFKLTRYELAEHNINIYIEAGRMKIVRRGTNRVSYDYTGYVKLTLKHWFICGIQSTREEVFDFLTEEQKAEELFHLEDWQ